MSTEIITATTASAKGSLSAVLATSKAFVVAHPMGMAVTGGALIGIGGYVALGRYFSKRKEKRETLKQAVDNAVAAQVVANQVA